MLASAGLNPRLLLWRATLLIRCSGWLAEERALPLSRHRAIVWCPPVYVGFKEGFTPLEFKAVPGQIESLKGAPHCVAAASSPPSAVRRVGRFLHSPVGLASPRTVARPAIAVRPYGDEDAAAPGARAAKAADQT
jgi:hypothetical protein